MSSSCANTLLLFSLLGPPGAGKTTIAKRLAERYGFLWISFGQIFRDTPITHRLSPVIHKCTESGISVPPEIAYDRLNEWLANRDFSHGICFDSQPRNYEDISYFEEFITSNNLTLQGVIYLEVDEQEIQRRLQIRKEIENRHDETPEVIETRLSVYNNDTKPVIDYYKKQGIALRIDGNQAFEQVYASVEEIIQANIHQT